MPYIKVPLTNIIEVEKIISVYNYSLPPDYRYEGESHDFWELIYVKGGALKVGSGEHLFDLGSGEVVFHRPHRFHYVRCSGELGAEVIIVGFESRSAAVELFGDRILTVPPEHRHLIDDVLAESDACFVPGVMPLTVSPTAPPGQEQLLRLALEGFLIRLLQSESHAARDTVLFRTREELEARLAEDIIDYLDAHIYERITMDELAARFHFGTSHLSHVFKAHTGTSIIRSFIDKKLARAKLLLTETDDTVAAISERLSFESPQYFAKLFRRYVGTSPTAYRKEHR